MTNGETPYLTDGQVLERIRSAISRHHATLTDKRLRNIFREISGPTASNQSDDVDRNRIVDLLQGKKSEEKLEVVGAAAKLAKAQGEADKGVVVYDDKQLVAWILQAAEEKFGAN